MGPKFDWVRKADDTFMEWADSLEELESFYSYINSIHPTIKWSKQVEEGGTMSFLDVQIIRTPDGIQTTVYRKPSASDRYTHFSTAQAWKEKIITITTLRQRAEIYCSTQDLKLQELQHLEQTFIANGYPPKIIQRYLYKNNPTTTTPSTDADNNIYNNFYAPYHPLAHNLFKKLQQKFNITPLYQKTTTLKDLLYHSRPSQEPIHTPGAVYAIPCIQCPKYYVGETKRPTSVRIKEKQRDLRLAKLQPNKKFSEDNDFGYVQHFKDTNHQFNFPLTKVIDQEPNHYRRKLLEGLYIQKNLLKVVNLKAGTSIDKCWLPLLTTMKKFEI